MRLGTLVAWRTSGGTGYGVVVGHEGKDLLCVSAFHRSLKKDRVITQYQDEALTDQLGKVQQPPGTMMNVQRVPVARATKRGQLSGASLRVYTAVAVKLQQSPVSEAAVVADRLAQLREDLGEAKWIQTAVKRPGRLRRILGVSDEEWETMGKPEKLKRINAKLKTSTDKSERGALLLGKRFIGGKEFRRAR